MIIGRRGINKVEETIDVTLDKERLKVEYEPLSQIFEIDEGAYVILEWICFLKVNKLNKLNIDIVCCIVLKKRPNIRYWYLYSYILL